MVKNLESKKLGASERYEISKELFRCRMTEGSSVHAHVVKMIGLIKRLARYGFFLDHGLCIDLILHSLPPSFSDFLVIYHMKEVDTSFPELLRLLTPYECSLPKEKATVVLLTGGSSKAKGKANKKGSKKAGKLGSTGGIVKRKYAYM